MQLLAQLAFGLQGQVLLGDGVVFGRDHGVLGANDFVLGQDLLVLAEADLTASGTRVNRRGRHV